MTVFDELKARGLLAQLTDEEEIKELINNGKATFYIGFDPTADSLHVGHFMALCLMKRMQMAGNKPIALIGGGTGMVGDPSGRSDLRQMLTPETIQHNCDCFKQQMSRFIDFSDGKALMVNNADWLLKLNYVELLREVGACFSVNNMLRAECYKQRMAKGLSFLEFNYMIMQSYDFYHLFQNYGCNMEFGGDDQWSNMLGGTELIRRNLLNMHRRFKALGLFQSLQRGAPQRANALHAQYRARFACPALAQILVFELAVVDGVVHEVHQVGHNGFRALFFQQIHQVVVRHGHILHQNFADDAHARLLHVLVNRQMVKVVH